MKKNFTNYRILIKLFIKRLPFLGFLLISLWNLLSRIRFVWHLKTLQWRARKEAGNDQLHKELTLYFKTRKLYQPLVPSDLQDITSPSHREGEKRFQAIKENLTVKSGTLLDIGANLGYFCYRLGDEGFKGVAVEENRMLCYFAQKLREKGKKKFEIVPKSIFEWRKEEMLEYDVILALSIFHNFLARKDLYLELLKLLGRLRAKEMFFETCPVEHYRIGDYYKELSPKEFLELIYERTHFRDAKFIGYSEDKRPLYRLRGY